MFSITSIRLLVSIMTIGFLILLHSCGVSPSQKVGKANQKPSGKEAGPNEGEETDESTEDGDAAVPASAVLPTIQLVPALQYVSRQSISQWEVEIEALGPKKSEAEENEGDAAETAEDSISISVNGLSGNLIQLNQTLSSGNKIITVKGFDQYRELKAIGSIQYDHGAEKIDFLKIPIKDIPPDSIALKGVVDVVRRSADSKPFKFQGLITKMQANCAFAGCHSNDSSSNTKLEQFPFKYVGFDVTTNDQMLKSFIEKVLERVQLPWSDSKFMPKQVDITDDQKGEPMTSEEVTLLVEWSNELTLPEAQVDSDSDIAVKVMRIVVTQYSDQDETKLNNDWHVYFVDPYKPFDIDVTPGKKYRIDMTLIDSENRAIASKWIALDTNEARTFSATIEFDPSKINVQ